MRGARRRRQGRAVARALLALLLAAAAPGCSRWPAPLDGDVDVPVAPPDVATTTDVDEDAGADAADAAASDARPSQCPPPPRVTPADVPRGYLAPVVVSYIRTVDGDTAHFGFPGSGEQIARFLFVNTEESHGTATTAFGVETGRVVTGYLSAAREIVVAVREDTARPGMPDLDPYGRWLSLIFVDGELLQTRLVREGLSAYYTLYGCAPAPVHNALLYAEAEANAAQRGIWAPGHPTDYRPVLDMWIRGGRNCRPNPFLGPYCR